MYRNCIFCSASLGANDALASIPVGSQLAFDGWKGRLWVVCPRCARWNLAPIEERWEPVEQAEKLFRDAKLRVHSENIGLARLPEGTRLIRIGKALPGELAAWRYGRQLLKRRNRYLLGVGGVAAVTVGLTVLPLAFLGTGGAGYWIYLGWQNRQRMKVVQRIRADDSTPDMIIRRWHVEGMSVGTTADGDVEVIIRDAHKEAPLPWTGDLRRTSRDIVTVSHDSARVLLARALVCVNQQGASRNSLESATQFLTDSGSAEDHLRNTTAQGLALGKYAGRDPRPVEGPQALALEMALNEEAERRALEGELAELEAAWREAEEIAAIADALPDPIRLPRWLRR